MKTNKIIWNSYQKFFKRFFDLYLSFILFLAFSPVFLLLCFLLFANNKGKVFFVQKRRGLNGKIIHIFKFRTLHEIYSNGELLPDPERVDTLGLFLRNTHLDELPQFLNILKGELSLIGPRPLIPDYPMYFGKTVTEREIVKPGLTGLTQINGGNDLPWQIRFKYDAFYAKHLSFGLDFYIFSSTITLFIRNFSKKHKKSAPFSVSYIK